ncbi:MAG TPA: hypothetical protein VMX16_17910 [Terriglobia bacterium]|nr:hypothetical protein [Terriglobia bacterium]
MIPYSGPIENLNFCALEYLNDWYRYDYYFVVGLCSEDEDEQLRWLVEAVNVYRIARNFKARPGEVRLKQALRALNATGDSITDTNIVSAVRKLAGELGSPDGKVLISAASKLLWFRYKSPVVIYDGRAHRCLSKQCSGKLAASDYGAYYYEWREQFLKREEHIRSACSELSRVKEFSRAYAVSNKELGTLVGNGWFRERVFDKFLWWNGGD